MRERQVDEDVMTRRTQPIRPCVVDGKRDAARVTLPRAADGLAAPAGVAGQESTGRVAAHSRVKAGARRARCAGVWLSPSQAGVRWIACAALVTLLCLGAAACDEKLSSLTGPTPGLDTTWASIHANIITSSDSSGRPACTQCHTNVGRNPAGRLNLAGDAASAYAALVNRPSSFKAGAMLIIPGDPDNSYFVHKLAGAPDITGSRMPLSGPPFLTDGQLLVIERWIRNGAANN